MRNLILYGTEGCHLCEIAEQMLLPFVSDSLQIELVDIMDDAKALNDFRESIPVLRDIDTQNLLYWPFDENQLMSFIRT